MIQTAIGIELDVNSSSIWIVKGLKCHEFNCHFRSNYSSKWKSGSWIWNSFRNFDMIQEFELNFVWVLWSRLDTHWVNNKAETLSLWWCTLTRYSSRFSCRSSSSQKSHGSVRHCLCPCVSAESHLVCAYIRGLIEPLQDDWLGGWGWATFGQ